jgi:hypothetical protein
MCSSIVFMDLMSSGMPVFLPVPKIYHSGHCRRPVLVLPLPNLCLPVRLVRGHYAEHLSLPPLSNSYFTRPVARIVKAICLKTHASIQNFDGHFRPMHEKFPPPKIARGAPPPQPLTYGAKITRIFSIRVRPKTSLTNVKRHHNC